MRQVLMRQVCRQRVCAALIALPLTFGVAMAQEAKLTDMSACRLNEAMVTLKFTFEGSACDELGTSILPAEATGTAIYEVPVLTTAEICTQQIVPISFEQAIAAPEAVEALDVRIVEEQDSTQVRASGTVDIAAESEDCMPPDVMPTGG